MSACLVPVTIEMFGDVVTSGDILIDNTIAPNFKTLLVHNVTCMGKAHLQVKSVINKKVKVMHNALKGKSWRTSSAPMILMYHPSC